MKQPTKNELRAQIKKYEHNIKQFQSHLTKLQREYNIMQQQRDHALATRTIIQNQASQTADSFSVMHSENVARITKLQEQLDALTTYNTWCGKLVEWVNRKILRRKKDVQ